MTDSIGFTEVIRQELLPFGIQVHLFLPAAMLTPGYDEEVGLLASFTV
jgi:short-subunit dehydrogenase